MCSALLQTLACKVPGVNKNASTNTSSASQVSNGIKFSHSGHVYYNEKYPTKESLSKIDFGTFLFYHYLHLLIALHLVSKGNHFYPFVTVRETILHYARMQYPQLEEDELTEKVCQIHNILFLF